MKVVITRDRRGYMEIWPIKALASLYKTDDGVWFSDSKAFVDVGKSCIAGVCKLLGFTPRKGSKQVVDITVKRLKK